MTAQKEPRVTRRPRHSAKKRFSQDAYQSATLELLGMASPYEHAVATAPEAPLVLPEMDIEELETAFPTISTLPRDADAPVKEGGLVERLWAATETDERSYVVPDWSADTPLDRVTTRVKSVAIWPILLVILAIGVGLLIWNLRSIPRGQAEDIKADWRTGVVALQAEIETARSAAGVLTDPSVPLPALAEARANLIAFDTNAANLGLLVTRPFPTPPPLASGDAFDPLKPIQQDLILVTDTVEAIDSDLADAAQYRNLLAGAFQLPNLPLVADGIAIDELSAELAGAISTSRSAVRQLPRNDAFSSHREELQSVVTRLDSWQAAYLDSLRLGDIESATGLIGEIQSRIDSVRGSLSVPLGLIGDSVDQRLSDLEGLLAGSLAALSN